MHFHNRFLLVWVLFLLIKKNRHRTRAVMWRREKNTTEWTLEWLRSYPQGDLRITWRNRLCPTMAVILYIPMPFHKCNCALLSSRGGVYFPSNWIWAGLVTYFGFVVFWVLDLGLQRPCNFCFYLLESRIPCKETMNDHMNREYSQPTRQPIKGPDMLMWVRLFCTFPSRPTTS